MHSRSPLPRRVVPALLIMLVAVVVLLALVFQADIAAYDRVHVQILDMADMLSTGIIRQFPKRFR
jgi:hypothetical protein